MEISLIDCHSVEENPSRGVSLESFSAPLEESYYLSMPWDYDLFLTKALQRVRQLQH